MNAGIKTAFFIALLMGLCSAAEADGLVRVEQTIFGMDCAPCAYGMQKNLGKLTGVSKVDVSIEQGVAVIDFAPNSPTTLADIHEVVLHGGLTPEKIVLTVQGSVTQRGDKLVLTDGSKEEYVLTGLEPGADREPQTRHRVKSWSMVRSPAPWDFHRSLLERRRCQNPLMEGSTCASGTSPGHSGIWVWPGEDCQTEGWSGKAARETSDRG